MEPKSVTPITVSQRTTPTILTTATTKTVTELKERKPKTVSPCCEICGKTNQSTERCYVRANAANRTLPWKSKSQQQDAQDSITGCVRAKAQHLN